MRTEGTKVDNHNTLGTPSESIQVLLVPSGLTEAIPVDCRLAAGVSDCRYRFQNSFFLSRPGLSSQPMPEDRQLIRSKSSGRGPIRFRPAWYRVRVRVNSEFKPVCTQISPFLCFVFSHSFPLPFPYVRASPIPPCPSARKPCHQEVTLR